MNDFFGNGINFLVIVFGLVEFAKKFGIEGRTLTALSMVLGVAIGIFYQLAQKYPAVGEWFQVVMFGLAVGLAASGIYDFMKKRIPKVEG